LPNGWHSPFAIYLKSHESYDFMIQNYTYEEPWQMGETIGNNATYYFLLDVGNSDWEEW
jgi:hypothetical protein